MNDERITQRHRVIAFDMPGTANPRRLPAGTMRNTFTSAQYTTMILAIMTALELDRPILIGCSIAGASRCIWRSNTPNASAPSSACRPVRMSIPITT